MFNDSIEEKIKCGGHIRPVPTTSSFPGAFLLTGIKESKWSLECDCHSLTTLQGGDVHHQHPGGSGERAECFKELQAF